MIAVGVQNQEGGDTTIINQNDVGLENRVVALENNQDLKTAATGKIFVVWTGVGYEYDVTYPLYYINEQAFPAGTDRVTLEASDELLDRTDTFGLNASGAFAIKGTPAAEPLAPTVDTANEIFVTTRDVKANTTEPEADAIPVANVDVYKENNEWTGTSVTGISNFNHGSKSFEGSKNIRLQGVIKLKDTVNVHDKTNFAALRLKILSSYQGVGYASFSFQFFLDDVAVSSTETIRAGLDFSASSTDYKTVLVDIDSFVFSNNNFNAILITPIKGAKFTGYSLFDNISLVAGSINVVNSPATSIDMSPFVLKSSFGWFPINPTGVVIDYNLESVGSSSFALFGTATEMHSIRYSNFNPIVYRGQDFYFRNDQATNILFKHEALVRIQERFVFTSPDETDIIVKPKEIVHFKANFTEYNGGALEYVGIMVYSKDETDTLLNSKADRILSLKPITGTTYNVIADDSLVELVYDGTDPMNVIIPNNTTVPLSIGTVFYSVATNTGILSVSGGVGVTFQTAVGLSGGQNEVRKYTKRATNVWGIEGSVVSSADMILANAQTVSGLKTFLNTMFGLRNSANTFTNLFSVITTAARTWTWPDKNGTIAMTSDIAITTTVKTIVSTALATQNVAGFVTYINALNPVLVVGANETVTYKTSDTGRIFELLLRGRSFGTGQAAITAADVIEQTEWMSKDVTLSNYPSTRNDGALPTNKVLSTDANGNLKLYGIPILPAPFILELIPDSHLPSSTGNIELLGDFFIPSMCLPGNLNNNSGIQIVGQTINYAVFINSQKILMNVTTGAAEGSFSITCNNGLTTTKTGALLIVYGAVYSPMTAEWSSVTNLVVENDSVDLSVLNVQGSATWNREFDFTKNWRLIFNANLSPLGAANLDRNLYQQTRLELVKVSDSSVVFGYQIYQQAAGPGNMNHNGYTVANGWQTVALGGSIGLDTDLNAWESLKSTKQYSLDYIDGTLFEKINGTAIKTHTDILTENLKLRVKPKNYKFENIKYIELT